MARPPVALRPWELPNDIKALLPMGDLLNVDPHALILQWARHNATKLSRAYLLKGGWEGWAQVEIALMLEDHYAQAAQALQPAVITVHRELAVYNQSQQRADIIIAIQHGHKKDHIIIELKCEGAFTDADSFLRAVLVDDTKLDKAISPRYGPAKRQGFAFSTSQQSYNNLRARLSHDEIRLLPGGGRLTLWAFEAERAPENVYGEVSNKLQARGIQLV